MSSECNKKWIFLTFNDLITKLKNQGLIVWEEQKLLWYIKSYNYQNIIQNFRKPFYKINNYFKWSNSQMIIDLFNFNRNISTIIINDLHDVEMKLSSAISYEIMTIIKAPSLISLKEENIIFNVKLNKLEETYKIIETNFAEIKKKKEFKSKNLTNWKTTPLYILSLMWTFGISINIFSILNNSIQKKILQNYFPKIKDIELDTFKSLLYAFKDLRNKISHNNIIYDFKFKYKEVIYQLVDIKNNQKIDNKIKRKIEKDFLQILNNQNGINCKLMNVIKIIALINNNNQIEDLILNKLKNLKESIYYGKSGKNMYHPCKQAWKNILNFLGMEEKEEYNYDLD